MCVFVSSEVSRRSSVFSLSLSSFVLWSRGLPCRARREQEGAREKVPSDSLLEKEEEKRRFFPSLSERRPRRKSTSSVSSLLPSRSLSLLPAPSTQNTNPSPFADGVDGRLRQAVVLGRDPDRDRLKGDPDERRRRRRGKSGSVGRVAAFVLARRRHRRLERVELGLDVVGLVMVIGLGGKKETTRRVSTSFIFIFSKPSPCEIGSCLFSLAAAAKEGF